MEKESVKKFDLEAAFKALDEIEIPQTKGIKANRVDLKERFGHKPATETLVEDYYDVSSTEDLEDAKEERDGEIAKAKLARIEKIVDLNAETPEDLLPSYVGKVIMQCPQCMTLFYKNQEDIEPSDENPDIVNLNEPCQHCGNTSGYTLIGKVGAVSEDEADKYDETSAEENELDLDFGDGTEEVDAEGTGEGAEEMSDEESSESEEDLDLDLNLDEVPEEEPEEEKKEESLNLSKEASENESEHKSENLTLNEEVDKDLDEKLKAHNDYIAYLQQMIKQEEEALKKAENDEIKAAIQRRLDAFNADLEAALPDAVKAEAPVEETEETIESATDENKTEEKLENLALNESAESEIDSIIASWGVNEGLNLQPSIADRFTKSQLAELTPEEIKILQEPHKNRAEVDKIIAKYNPKYKVNEAVKAKTTDKLCSVVLGDRQCFVGTKEECEKFIKDHESEEAAKELGGYKLLNTAEIYVDESLIKEDESMPLRSIEVKDKENSRKGISWQVFYGEKDSLHKEFKNEEEAKKFAAENNGKLMPFRSTEVESLNLTEEGNLDRLLDSDEFKTPVSEEEIDAARREVAKESLEEKCGKQKITEESDSEIAAIINSWEDTQEAPVEESCEGPECESKEECDDCLKEEKEDESEVEETDSSEDSEEVCFTAEEVKDVATDVAQSLATPVEDEEEAEKQAEEIAEVVDDKVDEAIEEKIEEAEAEEDESNDEESEVEIEEPEFNEDDIDELDEDSLNKHIDEYLKEVYSNVKSYETTGCELKEGKLIVEGKISFNSGKEKLTMFEFLPAYCEGSLFFEGYNKDFSEDKAFTLNCSINESKTLITESFGYKYKINENLVEGLK